MIPKEFRVGGRKYKVFFLTLDEIKKRDSDAEDEDEENISGWTNFNKGEVYILDDGVEDEWCHVQAFFHELQHVFKFHMGFYNTDEHDEHEIELRGNLQHQFEQTRRGELEV